jgi:hypothetical protein
MVRPIDIRQWRVVMQLINTDGLALIGPGSEWFWTALSGIVLAVTFLAIYRQLRLQSSQSAIEQLQSVDLEWFSERMTHHKLDVYVALRDGTDPAHIPFAAAYSIAGFWEKVALLVRGGHIDRRLVWTFGRMCQDWWAKLAPFIGDERVREGGPLIYEHFEWLAGVMAEMDRKAGAPTLDQAKFASGLDDDITTCQDRIRVEQALRTVVIAPSDAATA